MCKYIIPTLILFIPTLLWAQKEKTDANIIGDVQCNGEHVPFITIQVEGTTLGTATDATGHYQLINLPVGEVTLIVSGVGYKATQKQVTLIANHTAEVNFKVEEDILNIQGVVVTADRNQTNRAESPVVITSISPKLMQTTQSVNIAEGLNFTPGLRTETNCQNCGFTQLRMNGMEGPYTQILLNSRPVFSGLAGVYGLELIPSNMVERMEVVRGGGSSLFGGNAIAGTVNIITKESIRNTFNLENRLGIVGVGLDGTPALDEQFNMNASIVSDDQKSGGYMYGMLRNRDSYDINGDGFTESVELQNTTFGINAFYKPGNRSKISLDGYRISEYRRGGNDLDKLPHEADIAEQLEHLISGANLSFDVFTHQYNKFSAYASAQHVLRDSYYGAQQDPNAYGDTKNLTSSLGANYTMVTDAFLFAPSTTIVGMDNSNDNLHDVKLGANGDPNTTLTHQMVNTFGTYLQHDWKAEKFNISLGARYDYYQVVDKENTTSKDLKNGVLVPRASVMYKLTPDMRFRVGYARGYRAPQVFNEDLHIELVNATRVLTFNAEDLKQETSNAYSASFNSVFTLGSTYNDVLIEGFYTQLIDPFNNEFYPLDDAGNFAYRRVNADDGAHVAGVNLEWKSMIGGKFETQVGFTLQQSKYETPQAWGNEDESVSSDFVRTPNRYGYATVMYRPTEHLKTSLSLNYTGPMLVPHLGLKPEDFDDPEERDAVQNAIDNGDIIEGESLLTSPDFFVIDLLVSYDMHINRQIGIELFAGVKNLFNQMQNDYDRGVYRDAAYMYGPALPRTINFGVKFGHL